MPKRRSDWLGVGRKAKRQRQRRHVYFVIDDGAGYAIRKVDLSPDYDSDDDAAHQQDGTIETTGVASPLPRPLIRLPGATTSEAFAASGTKILATGCRWPEGIVPAFDVLSRSLTLGPRPHDKRPRNGMPLYMPVGRKLVCLVGSSVEFLDPPPPERSNFDWSWEELDDAPFTRAHVVCYAAHPDGRTLLVSTATKGSPATFTLDTEEGVWTKHGEWKLPFRGHAQFDPALDAWVGIPRGKGTRRGHLCSCDVVSINTVQPTMTCDVASAPADPGNNSSPGWKLSKEKMFCEDPAEEHHGAVLVYMGGRSKYCLLQCFSVIDVDGVDSDDEDDPYKEEVREEDLPRRHLFRLTTFTLKYNENGELSTAKRRRVRCYELLPHLDPLYNDFRAFLI